MLLLVSPILHLQRYLTGGLAAGILIVSCRVEVRAVWQSWPLLFTTWSERFQLDPSLEGSSVILGKQVKLRPSAAVLMLCKYLCISSHLSALLSDLAEVLV